MEPLLGQVIMFAGNFAPRGWAFCDGQLLAINQNQALFSILGATYGGDGRTSFALPDLRGRAPIATGRGPGLSNVDLGQRFGAETTTLTPPNLPPHSHNLMASDRKADNIEPADHALAPVSSDIYSSGTPNVQMNAGAVSSTGSAQPFNNMQPSLGINYIIALQGIYPPRS